VPVSPETEATASPRGWPAWGDLLRLIRFDRPIGTLLLLWPTLAALLLAADGLPPWWTLTVFVLGVFLTRSAGCVINDYADRWLDHQVERTRLRPLATGAVSPKAALVVFALLMGLAFLLVLTTNPATIALSVLALVLAVGYPYAKRHTHLPQVLLGAAFGMGIPMAYTAVGGDFAAIGLGALLLYLANLCWTVAYDTWYAMVDREDDCRAGSRSTAILFGRHDLLVIGCLQVAAWIGFAATGWVHGLGPAYAVALLGIAALMAQQLWRGRRRERAACFAAFLANNRVGLLLVLGIAADLAMAGWFSGTA
jgi:4-hydroxybenzoate polyprenyltransferase